MVEVEYLIALANEKKIKDFSSFSDKQKTNLRKLYKNFSDADATQIITVWQGHNSKCKVSPV